MNRNYRGVVGIALFVVLTGAVTAADSVMFNYQGRVEPPFKARVDGP